MAKKKYDPLWEAAGDKRALQGQEPDVDAICPHCNVTVHLGTDAQVGRRYACGLCGGRSEVFQDPAGGLRLRALAE